MAKKSFLAEVNRAMQQDARRREQEQRQAVKAQATAQRQAEQAARQAERAKVQAEKALAIDCKKAEQEAKRLHAESMQAEVEAKNTELAAVYEEIDGLLAATLEVDDYVDLENLRQTVGHPPFEPGQLAFPSPQPAPIEPPPPPEFLAPDGAPTGMSKVFGGKKKYAELVAHAEQAHVQEMQAWQAEVDAVPARQERSNQEYAEAEKSRLAALESAKTEYDEQCRQREAEISDANQQLDQLIANLGYEVEDAIQEYVSIVLENSIYPVAFSIEHDFEFDSQTRELTMRVKVPHPSDVPSVREYKYVKAKDEINEAALTQKAQKERYAGAIAQVALRSLHEIFEADRAARIQTISLIVTTEGISPATGQMEGTPLLAVGTDRDTFDQIDLANVLPLATLEHLNALVSKNPWGLAPIDLSKGIRG